MMPLLQGALSRNAATEILMDYKTAVVRLILAKKLPHLEWPLPQSFAAGSCAEDKHAALLAEKLGSGARPVLLQRDRRGGPQPHARHLDFGVCVVLVGIQGCNLRR